ncbi:hypothetical protein SEUCBS140593_000739 [Sporothrix eucalyptigena]|uniref:Homeobox domain-containing protein n=1 Tax=Sporothrix eucalyptigena TaxID=1812306 RepID=A0ABP0ASM8_9PEZI
MESELPATSSPAVATRPDGNASTEPLTSSPRSSGSINIDKADESFSSLSSDAGDQSMLRHPKGKRKRTAAKDKSILEAAYQANPKPDKTARLDIVSRVSLNEKEVQIWFQNRRQNDRRKSRPLSPQELEALRHGGLKAIRPDLSPTYNMSGLCKDMWTGQSSPPHYQPFTSASMTNALPSTTPASSPEIGPWTPDALAQKHAAERQQQSQEMALDRTAASEGSAPAAQTPSGLHSFSSSVGSVGYLANRWNMHSSYSTPSSLSGGNGAANGEDGRDESVRLERFVRPSSSAPVLPPPQQHMSSQQPHQRPFRLSLSLEGKAEVISGQSPSPPRRLPPPNPTLHVDRRTGSSSSSSSSSGSDSPLPSLPAIRRSGLSRSQSALPSLGLTLPPISSLTNSLASGSAPPPLAQPVAHPPRLLRGRSRDVHAWESVCDAETRVDDELSAHAEEEASGSAIAAISLLRSTSSLSNTSAASSSSVLQPNGHRRNSSSRSGIPRPGMKRAKLGRALSSVARMQNVSNAREPWQQESGKDKVWVDDEKKKKLKLSTLLSGNDSDKENWSPDEEGRPRSSANMAGNNGRRPLPSARAGPQRSVLGSDGSKGNKNPQLSATRGGKAGAFDGLDIYEDVSSGGPPPKRAQLSRAATVAAPDDVERFMRGAQVSPSKKGDMDCIAGLLSLSQGNWR